MNIKLSVSLQLPKECEKYSNEELHYLLSDAVIRYAAVSHHKDAAQWCTRANQKDKNWLGQALVDYHTRWGDICSAATFEIENIKSKNEKQILHRSCQTQRRRTRRCLL